MNTTFNIQLCSVTSKIAKKQNGNNFRDFRSHRKKKMFSVEYSIETEVSRNKGSFGVKRYNRSPGSAR